MSLFRNFQSVKKTAFGRGSFNHLDEIIEPHRGVNAGFMLFVVDDVFEGHALANRIPVKDGDVIEFINSWKEPTTDLIDDLRDRILNERGLPDGIIGIGGGGIMDIAKAGSLMFTNEGSSVPYQGLNLVKRPGIWHCGVPTISGTGAEVSMTAVLTGPVKKLGLKCDWTVFDQIVMDPELTAGVPVDQWFYTGMDSYIHCVESITGSKNNAFSTIYANEALDLCREVFLELDREDPKSADQLMIASYMGGISLTYSEVGVCHALSYGLSKILEVRHGLANCMAFYHLEDVYGEYVNEFKTMIDKHGVDIPQGQSAEWSDETIDAMTEVAYNLPHMWDHAFGPDWKQVLDRERIKDWYRRM